MCVFKVCFSNKSTLEILDNNYRYVRRRPGEEFLPQFLAQKVKHPTKVFVWSVISFKGPGRPYIVNGMMNAKQYKKVMRTCLVPQLEDWFPDENCIYMQDRAPCHTTNILNDYFVDIGMEVLPWPASSPVVDMNLIEGIWHNLKDSVNEVTTINKRDLIERINHVWYHNPDITHLISK
ncbi:uncharacterized protein LOC136082960 [Hydra vulgaris]|uniref:Uncharacterized protein LOC136082960 n=1 Tax=Hydra vulgaris TaxID=6087 RepID=A0ABM4C9V5_HYDVU